MEPLLLTLSLMTFSLLGAVPLGVVWGWSVFHLQHRSQRSVRSAARLLGRMLMVVMIMMLALPLYVHAAAWEGAAGKFGWLPLVQGGQRAWFQGLLAASWIHASYGACWIGMITAVSLRRIPSSISAAARLDAATGTRDLRISIPIAMPWIAAGAVWVALLAVTEMTVADLYAVSTLADVVYKIYALDPEPLPVVASLMLPAVIITPAVWWLASRSGQFHWTMRGAGDPGDSHRRDSHRGPTKGRGESGGGGEMSPRGEFGVGCVAVGITLLVVLVPAASLVVKAGWTVTTLERHVTHAFTLGQLASTLADSVGTFGREIGWSSQLAALSAVLCVPAGWAAARFAQSHPRCRGPVATLMLLMVMIPGPVVSLAVIQLFNRPLLGPLYDRTLVPTLVALIPHTLPVAYLILRGGYRLLDHTVDELSVMDGCGPFVRIFRVEGPRLRGAIVLACLAVVLVAVADLSSTLLVLPPGVTTIASRLFGLLHSGVRNQEAGLALITTLGVGAVTAIGVRWLR